jgi:hypothetical protein
MKNFDLNALGVEEMTQEELVLVDGGGNIFKAIGEAIGKAIDAVGEAVNNAIDAAGEAVGEAWDWVKTHTVLSSNGGTGILLPG